jgi:hypothetical protein
MEFETIAMVVSILGSVLAVCWFAGWLITKDKKAAKDASMKGGDE